MKSAPERKGAQARVCNNRHMAGGSVLGCR